MTIPMTPKTEPEIRKRKRHTLSPLIISTSLKSSPHMEVIAITIILIGETIPADTAASPSINPPTTLIAVPIV